MPPSRLQGFGGVIYTLVPVGGHTICSICRGPLEENPYKTHNAQRTLHSCTRVQCSCSTVVQCLVTTVGTKVQHLRGTKAQRLRKGGGPPHNSKRSTGACTGDRGRWRVTKRFGPRVTQIPHIPQKCTKSSIRAMSTCKPPVPLCAPPPSPFGSPLLPSSHSHVH